jgi:hypothetical protein
VDRARANHASTEEAPAPAARGDVRASSHALISGRTRGASSFRAELGARPRRGHGFRPAPAQHDERCHRRHERDVERVDRPHEHRVEEVERRRVDADANRHAEHRRDRADLRVALERTRRRGGRRSPPARRRSRSAVREPEPALAVRTSTSVHGTAKHIHQQPNVSPTPASASSAASTVQPASPCTTASATRPCRSRPRPA